MCKPHIFTFLCPDSRPASADPPPSPPTRSSGDPDVNVNGTSELKAAAGNAPTCCVFRLLSTYS